MKELFPNVMTMGNVFIAETLNTLYMVIISALISGFFGLIMGVMLTYLGEGGLTENKSVYGILDKITNFFRAIPFVILIAIIAPFTRILTGTTIGEKAAIVPLVFGTIPFFAKQVESALHSVDSGVIEAAESMGLGSFEIMYRVYFREALPSLIRVSSITIISLIGLTAMAGVIGAGGLGKVAIAMGHQRFRNDVTVFATVLILVLVYSVQAISNVLVKKTTH